MTRKDFIELARTIKSILNRLSEINKEHYNEVEIIILDEIKGFCVGQNSLFDSKRFESAVKSK